RRHGGQPGRVERAGGGARAHELVDGGLPVLEEVAAEVGDVVQHRGRLHVAVGGLLPHLGAGGEVDGERLAAAAPAAPVEPCAAGGQREHRVVRVIDAGDGGAGGRVDGGQALLGGAVDRGEVPAHVEPARRQHERSDEVVGGRREPGHERAVARVQRGDAGDRAGADPGE